MTGDASGPGVQDASTSFDRATSCSSRTCASTPGRRPTTRRSPRAGFADLYVNDAFGSAHRAHASTEGITHFLPAVAGLLLEREVNALSRLLVKPPRPFHTVIGGAKISDKLNVPRVLVGRCQAILVGGGMANTFLAAKGLELGKSLVETEQLENAAAIIAEARRRRMRLILPTDVLVAAQVHHRAPREVVSVNAVPKDWTVVDIGPQTVEKYRQALQAAKTIFWNGPMGIFEVAHSPRARTPWPRPSPPGRRRAWSPWSAAETRSPRSSSWGSASR